MPSRKMAARYPVRCPLSAAFDETGNSLVVADNKITGISLAANQPLRLRVVLNRLDAAGIIRLETVHQIADRIIF